MPTLKLAPASIDTDRTLDRKDEPVEDSSRREGRPRPNALQDKRPHATKSSARDRILLDDRNRLWLPHVHPAPH